MTIKLYTNESDERVVTKTLTLVDTLTGAFRDDCDMREPVILLEASPADLAAVNYFELVELGRFYFLASAPKILRTGLLEITGRCDVLQTFDASIRAQTAIVKRAEDADAYNLYLDDGSLRVYANPYVLTEPFPSGFTGASFVLAVAGSAEPPTP